MAQPTSRRSRTSEFDIEYHPATFDDVKGKRFNLGVELATAHLRIGTLATDTRPTLEKPEPLGRGGFHAVGFHPWESLMAEEQEGRYGVSQVTAERVAAVLKQFLGHVGIEPGNVERIQVGTVITFDQRQGIAVWVDTTSVEAVLSRSFASANVTGGNRTTAALHVERTFGAGNELRPAERIIYITISRNINLDAFPNQATDTPFASGIRHARINERLLEDLGSEWIGRGYELPQLDKCVLCGKEFCLHSLASGQGMLDLIKGDISAEEAARTAAAMRPPGYAEERGAVTQAGIDTSSIFKAASYNETCRRVVLQAGIAIGIGLFEKIFEAGLFDADLIVVGGTVPMGMLTEDRRPLPQRLSIDGVMQRTLRRLLGERLPLLHVTRSRFAGFTALLGLSVTPP